MTSRSLVPCAVGGRCAIGKTRASAIGGPGAGRRSASHRKWKTRLHTPPSTDDSTSARATHSGSRPSWSRRMRRAQVSGASPNRSISPGNRHPGASSWAGFGRTSRTALSSITITSTHRTWTDTMLPLQRAGQNPPDEILTEEQEESHQDQQREKGTGHLEIKQSDLAPL